jgi:hypothetical protein
VRAIQSSGFPDKAWQAFSQGKTFEMGIGRRTILVEPNLPFSGMTLRGEAGFVMGGSAFASKEEFTKTLLHELYRLEHTKIGGGASQALVTDETKAAAAFAERAWMELFSK